MTSGVAVSNDLRQAITYMHKHRGLDVKQIVYLTGIPQRTVYRILSTWSATGEIGPASAGKRGRPRALDFADTQVNILHTGATEVTDSEKFLTKTLAHRNDMYLDELRDVLEERCGVRVSEATIWRTLNRAGFRMKEITKQAMERNELNRAEYRLHIGASYTPEQLVFVDESACDRRTYMRNRAWSLEGLRACRKQFFARGKRYSILPAISLDGIIECMIVEGSFNTEIFMRFIEDLLDKMQPFPAPKSVIIMDNCAIHKAPEIRELVEGRGMKLEYLPAYSPDFNPIELAFSLLKHRLRRCPPPTEGDEFVVYEHLYLQTFTISTGDCRAFYHQAGYL